MSDDNYVSPYGFGPVTDSVIDCVVDRHDIAREQVEALFEAMSEEQREEFEYWVGESWWTSFMGPAIDKMEDRLSEFLPEDE